MRVSRGLGIITQMEHILNTISLGERYFEIALLLRESMLINSVLSTSDIWYGLKTKEIESLETLDKLYLSKILSTKISTPYESYFLELGIYPFRVLIKAKRIKYMHYLLSRSPDEMIFKFFKCQWNRPTKGDWALQVKQDLLDFKIQSDFEYIQSFTKIQFKNHVNEKMREYAFDWLMNLKKSHSKMKSIEYDDLKMQQYFFNETASCHPQQTVFVNNKMSSLSSFVNKRFDG